MIIIKTFVRISCVFFKVITKHLKSVGSLQHQHTFCNFKSVGSQLALSQVLHWASVCACVCAQAEAFSHQLDPVVPVKLS